jgi:thioredoxin-related protein
MKNKLFVLILIVVLVILCTRIIFLQRENKSLTQEIQLLKIDDVRISHLNVQLFCEIFKKQHLNKNDLMSLFTFHNNTALLKYDNEESFLWKAFNDNNIDTCYSNTFSEILYLHDLDLFFLLNDGYLVDYRYLYANRKFLECYLNTGEFEIDD